MNIFMFRFMFSLFFLLSKYCIRNKWFPICYISNPLEFLKCYMKSKHMLEFIMRLMKIYIKKKKDKT